MLKKSMKKILASLLAAFVLVSMLGSTSVDAAVKASKVAITESYAVMSIGQSYSFGAKLSSSKAKDKITWKTSNKKVAKVSKDGKVTAVNTGTVTITASLKNGNKDSVKLLVVSKYGVSSLQSRIDKMLDAKNINNVYIKNLKTEENYVIKEGTYSKKTLRVNAPFSDVENNGKFKKIIINDVKNGTFIENRKGNKFEINDKDCALEITKNAFVYSLVQNAENGVLSIQNDGKLLKLDIKKFGQTNLEGAGKVSNILVNASTELTVGKGVQVDLCKLQAKDADVKLDVQGTMKEVVLKNPMKLEVLGSAANVKVKVEAGAAGSQITSSVPVSIVSDAKISVKLEKGAEASKISENTTDAKIDLTNETTAVIEVKKSTGEITKVDATTPVTPTPTVPGGAVSGGSSYPTVVDKQTVKGSVIGDKVAYTLVKKFNKITSATVNTNTGAFGKISKNVDATVLEFVNKQLTSTGAIVTWKNITKKPIDKYGEKNYILITGEYGSIEKTVTYEGIDFKVAVKESAIAGVAPTISITTKNGKTYTLSISADQKTLYIGGSNLEAIQKMVTFDINY